MEITVPLRGGNTTTLKGSAYGPFLIHRPASGWYEDRWDVTHRKTGLRFPCRFTSHENARKFMKKVQTIMDFDVIECSIPSDGMQGAWTKGEPTKKQKQAIKALMEKFGE
jgi:hypothetical protein